MAWTTGSSQQAWKLARAIARAEVSRRGLVLGRNGVPDTTEAIARQLLAIDDSESVDSVTLEAVESLLSKKPSELDLAMVLSIVAMTSNDSELRAKTLEEIRLSRMPTRVKPFDLVQLEKDFADITHDGKGNLRVKPQQIRSLIDDLVEGEQANVIAAALPSVRTPEALTIYDPRTLDVRASGFGLAHFQELGKKNLDSDEIGEVVGEDEEGLSPQQLQKIWRLAVPETSTAQLTRAVRKQIARLRTQREISSADVTILDLAISHENTDERTLREIADFLRPLRWEYGDLLIKWITRHPNAPIEVIESYSYEGREAREVVARIPKTPPHRLSRILQDAQGPQDRRLVSDLLQNPSLPSKDLLPYALGKKGDAYDRKLALMNPSLATEVLAGLWQRRGNLTNDIQRAVRFGLFYGDGLPVVVYQEVIDLFTADFSAALRSESIEHHPVEKVLPHTGYSDGREVRRFFERCIELHRHHEQLDFRKLYGVLDGSYETQGILQSVEGARVKASLKLSERVETVANAVRKGAKISRLRARPKWDDLPDLQDVPFPVSQWSRKIPTQVGDWQITVLRTPKELKAVMRALPQNSDMYFGFNVIIPVMERTESDPHYVPVEIHNVNDPEKTILAAWYGHGPNIRFGPMVGMSDPEGEFDRDQEFDVSGCAPEMEAVTAKLTNVYLRTGPDR